MPKREAAKRSDRRTGTPATEVKTRGDTQKTRAQKKPESGARARGKALPHSPSPIQTRGAAAAEAAEPNPEQRQSLSLAESPAQLVDPAQNGIEMKKEEGTDKVSAGEKAKEEEASTAPLPEKVSINQQFTTLMLAML